VKDKIVIWGASGHALVVADIIRLQGNYELVGYLDNVNSERHGTELSSAKILGGEEQLPCLFQQGIRTIIFGFGHCSTRLKLAQKVIEQGFRLGVAVHPTAIIAQDVAIKAGTVIAAGAIVNPGTVLGENLIINTGACIDHNCSIGDGTHIAPGVHIAGSVIVGKGSWVGIGVTVSDHITIGTGTLVGAGSLVLNDIPSGVVAYGIPAEVKRQVREGEI